VKFFVSTHLTGKIRNMWGTMERISSKANVRKSKFRRHAWGRIWHVTNCAWVLLGGWRKGKGEEIYLPKRIRGG